MLANGMNQTGNAQAMNNGKMIHISTDDYIRFKVPPQEFQDTNMVYPSKIHKDEIAYIGEYTAEIDEQGTEEVFLMPILATWVGVASGNYSLESEGGNEIDEHLDMNDPGKVLN